MKQLKNIGPDERNLPAFAVRLKPGESAEIGTAKGQIPEQAALELSQDEPARFQIVEEKPPKKDKA